MLLKGMNFWTFILIFFLFQSCIPGAPGPFKFRIKEVAQGNAQIDGEDIDLKKEKATYKNVVKHIFKAKCIRCHGNKRARLGVNLEEYEKVFDYSDYFTPIVVKNDPDASGAYTEVARGAMPPKNPLTEEEVEFIKRWIEEGAVEK
jgi:uncharacterized membrane protein